LTLFGNGNDFVYFFAERRRAGVAFSQFIVLWFSQFHGALAGCY
jgi:hypothetical protein